MTAYNPEKPAIPQPASPEQLHVLKFEADNLHDRVREGAYFKGYTTSFDVVSNTAMLMYGDPRMDMARKATITKNGSGIVMNVEVTNPTFDGSKVELHTMIVSPVSGAHYRYETWGSWSRMLTSGEPLNAVRGEFSRASEQEARSFYDSIQEAWDSFNPLRAPKKGWLSRIKLT